MRRSIGLAVIALAACLFLAVPLARAQGFRSGQTATVKSDETVDGTLFAAGNTVDIAGTVVGDVFCAGQNITVSGTIQGDVLCAGQNVTVSGTVEGDVRLAGQSVTVSGTVAGNATVGGQSFTLSGNGMVGGDITTGGSTVHIAGVASRDVLMGAQSATVSGSVGRNIKTEVEQLRLDSTAKVGGKLDYSSHNDASIDRAAQVQGGIGHSIPVQPTRRQQARGANYALAFIKSMSLAVVALVLILVAPQAVDSAAGRVIKRPLATLGAGLLFVFVGPIVLVALLVSLVGIPIAFIAFLAWILVMLLSGPMFAYLIGRLIWRSQDNAVLVMIVGVLIVLITYFLPVVGVIVSLASGVMGSGMIVLALKQRMVKPAYRVAPQKAAS